MGLVLIVFQNKLLTIVETFTILVVMVCFLCQLGLFATKKLILYDFLILYDLKILKIKIQSLSLYVDRFEKHHIHRHTPSFTPDNHHQHCPPPPKTTTTFHHIH